MKSIRSVSENTLSLSVGEENILSIVESFVGDQEDTVKMMLEGKFISEASHDFLDEMMALSSIGKSIILDFSKVAYMSSSCLRCILSVQQSMDNNGTNTMTLRNIPDTIYTELKNTGLTELLNVE